MFGSGGLESPVGVIPSGAAFQAKRGISPLKRRVRNSGVSGPALLDYCAVPAQVIFDVAPGSSMTNAKPTLTAELFAEFLGTFVLILFGIGVVAMVVLFPSKNSGETIHGGFTNITLGWGLAVTMGIYIAGKISGAHLNPAVTLALAVFRNFPWRKVVPYFVAQIAGALAAAALVYWNYLPAFRQVDPQLDRTAGVFTTFPAFPAVIQAGFLDQLIGTGLLVLMIFAITDEFNMPPGANLAPLMIGLVVVAIGMSFGGMHGYAINPARDFGPRLLTVLAGFRNNGLTDGARVWWVPVVAPLLGGLAGAALYDFGIRRFLKPPQ
jgi:glycerol uptake facilitator protein